MLHVSCTSVGASERVSFCGGDRGEVYTGFWHRNLRDSDHLGDLVVNGWIILKWILKESVERAWTFVNTVMNFYVHEICSTSAQYMLIILFL